MKPLNALPYTNCLLSREFLFPSGANPSTCDLEIIPLSIQRAGLIISHLHLLPLSVYRHAQISATYKYQDKTKCYASLTLSTPVAVDPFLLPHSQAIY